MQIIDQIILFLIGALVFILPIPHTIGVRNILIGLILLFTIFILIREKCNINFSIYKQYLKPIIIILTLLTLWIIIVSLFLNNAPWSYKEINSQWVVPLAYYVIFTLLAAYMVNTQKELQYNFYLIVLLAFFIHILYVDLQGLKVFIDSKVLLKKFDGLTEGPDKSNYLTNILLAFIISEVIYRLRTAKRFIKINNFVLILFLAAVILSTIFETMRNGIVAIVFLGFSTLFFSFYKNQRFSKRFKSVISLSLIVIISTPLFFSIEKDKRWNNLIHTIPYALDTQKYNNWINLQEFGLPKDENGNDVEGSAYLRIAWGYEGIKIILENPLGVGYGRNAFRHAIMEKYNLRDSDTNIGHSHSGIIDLTLSIGFPGLLLWLSFILYLIYLSYKYFIKYNSYFSLILFFNTTGFFFRFLVDSNMRDHMFQTFMLIIGFSLIFMLKEKELNEKDNLN